MKLTRFLMPMLLFSLTATRLLAQAPLPVINLTAESLESGNRMKVTWSNPYPSFSSVEYDVSVSGPLLSYFGSTTNSSYTFGTKPGGSYSFCVKGTAMASNGATVKIASSCTYKQATPPGSGGGGPNPDPCTSFYVFNVCESPASGQLTLKWFPPPGRPMNVAVMYVRCRVQNSGSAWTTDFTSFNTGACVISGLTDIGLYEVEYAACPTGSWSPAIETIQVNEW